MRKGHSSGYYRRSRLPAQLIRELHVKLGLAEDVALDGTGVDGLQDGLAVFLREPVRERDFDADRREEFLLFVPLCLEADRKAVCAELARMAEVLRVDPYTARQGGKEEVKRVGCGVCAAALLRLVCLDGPIPEIRIDPLAARKRNANVLVSFKC